MEVRGTWRLLEPSYLRTVVDLLMGVTMENDWSACAVPVEPAVAALVKVRREAHFRVRARVWLCEGRSAERRAVSGTRDGF